MPENSKNMKSVLILGGTGAMGTHLCKHLDNGEWKIAVTSRREQVSESSSLRYIQGNAKDISFVRELLAGCKYDVIIDFMSYTTAEFQERYDLLRTIYIYQLCQGLCGIRQTFDRGLAEVVRCLHGYGVSGDG